jgi:hypothetical protein
MEGVTLSGSACPAVALAGRGPTVQVTAVLLAAVTVQGTSPNSTPTEAASAAKPLPAMVTASPPAVLPLAASMLATVSGSARTAAGA